MVDIPTWDRGSTRDRGFTLTELLIVVVILGAVMVVIAATFSVIVRTSPTTQARADDSRALLNLTRWLPGDVASAEPGFISTAAADATCDAPADSVLLLALSWAQGPSRGHVDYRWLRSGEVSAGRELGSIRRFSCRGTATTVEELRMSDAMAEIGGLPPVTVSLIDAGGVTVGAEFEVTVLDEQTGTTRDILNLEMRSRNIPDDEIGDSDGTSGGFGPGNVAPIASTLVTYLQNPVEPQTIVVDLPVFDFDGTNDVLVVTATSSDGWTLTPLFPSDPPQLEIVVPAGAAGAAVGPDAYTEYVIDYIVSDRLGDFEKGALSDDGQVIVRVFGDPPPTPLPDDEILFPPPPVPSCSASISSIDPTNPRLKRNSRNPSSEVGPLDSSINIVITRNEYCGPLVIEFEPGMPTPESVFSESVRNNDTATLRNNAEEWVIGVRPLRLVERPLDSAPVLHDSSTVTVRRFDE